LIKAQRKEAGHSAPLLVDIVGSVVVQFQLLVVVVPVEVEAESKSASGIRRMPISICSQSENLFLLWFLCVRINMRQHPAKIIGENLRQKLASSVYIMIILSKFQKRNKDSDYHKKRFRRP